MKCFKGSLDYSFKRKKFLRARSGVKKLWKKISNKRMRKMNFDERVPNISLHKLDHVSFLFISQW